MSETITLTATTLPQGFCPATEQERLDEFAENLSVTIGDYYGQFVISSTTPAPGDQDKVWLKTDGPGNPIAFFKYAGGSWVQIDPPNVWAGSGGGTTNVYTLTVSNYPSAVGPRTNDVFFFSIPAAQGNTAASTLNLNGLGTKALKSGGADLWSGALTAGKWYSCVYDGTNYEVLGLKQLLASDIPAGSDNDFFRTRDVASVLISQWESPYVGAEKSVPSAGGSETWGHTLVTTPIAWKVVLINKTGEHGYSTNDEVPVEALTSTGGTGWQSTFANASTIGFVFDSGASGPYVRHKTTGASSAITPGNWKLKCYAIR